MKAVHPCAVFIAASSKACINYRYDLILALQQKLNCKIFALCPRDRDFTTVQHTLARINTDVISIDLRNNSLNPWYDFKAFIKMFYLIKKLRPTVIVSAAIKPVIMGLIIGRLLKIKNNIVLITGLGSLFTNQNLFTRFLRCVATVLYRHTLKFAHHIFFQNKDDHDLFINNRLITPQQCSITPGSGVNLQQFEYTPLPLYPPIKFLFIGRLIAEKGIVEFCNAAATVKKIYPQACFQVLGGFPSNSDAAPQIHIKQLLNGSDIDYQGEQPSALPFIQNAHIVVLPSYYREGIPKSLLEALSIGRPIITTDSFGCRETVIDGVNGYLVNPRDVQALSDSMIKMINRSDQLAVMAGQSRSLAESKFDVKIVNDIILNQITI